MAPVRSTFTLAASVQTLGPVAGDEDGEGGWAKGSKVMRCYREEDDGFKENALHGVL